MSAPVHHTASRGPSIPPLDQFMCTSIMNVYVDFSCFPAMSFRNKLGLLFNKGFPRRFVLYRVFTDLHKMHQDFLHPPMAPAAGGFFLGPERYVWLKAGAGSDLSQNGFSLPFSLSLSRPLPCC